MTPATAEWDSSNLEMISGGDPDVLQGHLRQFLETLAEESEGLAKAVRQENFCEIQRTAHRLLSHFAIVNAHELLELTRDMHRSADSRRIDAVKTAYASYSRLLANLQASVSAEAYPSN